MERPRFVEGLENLKFKVMENLKDYLNTCVCIEDLEYDTPKENTLKECAIQLFNETVKHDKRRMTQAEKFREAVQGLPPYLNMVFTNWEIINLMYAIGYNFDRNNEDECIDITNKYWTELGIILSNEFNN